MDPLIATAIGMTLVQGGLSWDQGRKNAKAAKQQAEYQRRIFEQNARFAKINAEMAVERGDKLANRIKTEGSKVMGAQRAVFAAQGLDTHIGTPADLIDETIVKTQLDMETAKNNAWRESWGYQVQAMGYQSQGNMAVMGANNYAKNAIFTGEMNALGSGIDVLTLGTKLFPKEDDPTKTKTLASGEESYDDSSYNEYSGNGNAGYVTFDEWIRYGYKHEYDDSNDFYGTYA